MELRADTVKSPSSIQRGSPLATFAHALCLALLLAVALHSWPISAKPKWQLLWPANLLLIWWVVLLPAFMLWRRFREQILAALPPVGVWAYIAVCGLSVAVADHAGRAATAGAKTALSLVGVYTLLRLGLSSKRRLDRGLWVIVVAVAAAVLLAGRQRLTGMPARGLFGSELKFGTFLAMGLPLAWAYLAASAAIWRRAASAVLLAAGLVVCPTVWGLVGICLGVLAAIVLSGGGWKRMLATVCPAALAVGLSAGLGGLRPVVADAGLTEPGGHIRQRYLEWQAQINLLGARAAEGTGIGSLNDHRGEYYLRLPKRNTIAEFDQNIWLSVAAETGVLGLVCFCWMVRDGLVRAVRRRRVAVVRAAAAGFAGALLAGVESSIQYSGVLVMFAVLLALIDWDGDREEHEPCA